MCVLAAAWNAHPDYRLVLAANRDEFFERPTAPAEFWPEIPGLLAGRDLKDGGTWMGVMRDGRFGVLTNYRDPSRRHPGLRSRGLILTDFFKSSQSPAEFLAALQKHAAEYNAFNLLVGDQHQFLFFSNVQGQVESLGPGIYGLSNHLLDTDWFKVRKVKDGLREILSHEPALWPPEILQLMSDTSCAPDAALPDTGVGATLERVLSRIRILGSRGSTGTYGTRSTTLLLAGTDRTVRYLEKTYHEGLKPTDLEVRFSIYPAP